MIKVLEAGEASVILDQFKVVGEVAVIDLDAAMGKGTNEDQIKQGLLKEIDWGAKMIAQERLEAAANAESDKRYWADMRARSGNRNR